MAKESDSTGSQNILLFELEGAALEGRAKLFEAAREVFSSAGVALKEQAFSKYCIHGSASYIAEQLVAGAGGGKLDHGAAEKIVADYVVLMRKAKNKSNAKLEEVLAHAIKRGIKVAALSVLPEDVAQAALEQSGLAAKGVELVLFPENERHFPRTECWLRVPRSLHRSPRACIAIAGCRDSGKSALSSGMRCIIIPDKFTSYQDFSGVDAVLDGSEDIDLGELIDAIA